jgi:carbon starvation protein
MVCTDVFRFEFFFTCFMIAPNMKALPFILVALGVLTIAYRYYSAFLAAKVLSLDDSRLTPAHRLADGHNYVPTQRWVLFGHHFAAITGAGPLIGPVLAAQFGFLPGFLWLITGVVIGGAVHDFVILTGSVRHNGKSIAQIAQEEMGPWAGRITGVAILFIVIVALAGLGLAVVNALQSSPWGTFTLASTVPVALIMGVYTGCFRKGKGTLESTIFGVICLLLAVIFGRWISETTFGSYFSLSRESLILSIAIYGFIASVLPVWLLLCPRDYLSSFMKLGTIGALTVAVLIVNPDLHAPLISQFVNGGGPIVPGKVFPFVFITIACGAISGFHSLIASGTTPKMISNERDCRVIGYGAMLCEAWVGLISLIAAAALFPEDYFAINVSPEGFSKLGMSVVHLPELSLEVGESVAGRPGGAVSLAVGMAQIFSKVPGLKNWMAYWYHFAILFEALFILTTIDSGTRVARFLVQEFLGKIRASWGRPDWLPGSLFSTTLVVAGWTGFIWTGSISTLWPLFGIANQLLASIALVIGTVWIIRSGRGQYAWVTLVPLSFVATTTMVAAVQSIFQNFLPLASQGHPVIAYLNSFIICMMMASLVGMLIIGMAQVMQLSSKRTKEKVTC